MLDYNYTVAYYSQGSISPGKWVRVRELLARNPGAMWLEKLALRYIRDKLAEIAGYPELWQLRNETLGLHLAKPVDGRYLVYYDVYENTVFCDWRRLLVHGR